MILLPLPKVKMRLIVIEDIKICLINLAGLKYTVLTMSAIVNSDAPRLGTNLKISY